MITLILYQESRIFNPSEIINDSDTQIVETFHANLLINSDINSNFEQKLIFPFSFLLKILGMSKIIPKFDRLLNIGSIIAN